MSVKLEHRGGNRETCLTGCHTSDALFPTYGIRQVEIEFIRESGFVIEQILLRWAAVLKQVNHPFCFGGEVGSSQRSSLHRRVAEQVVAH